MVPAGGFEMPIALVWRHCQSHTSYARVSADSAGSESGCRDRFLCIWPAATDRHFRTLAAKRFPGGREHLRLTTSVMSLKPLEIYRRHCYNLVPVGKEVP